MTQPFPARSNLKRRRDCELPALQIPDRKRRRFSPLELQENAALLRETSPHYLEFISTLKVVKRYIAKGSTSIISLLTDAQGRQYVSKQIKNKLKHSKDINKLLANEIRALTATIECLETPNLVAWHVTGEGDDQIIMEYIDSIQFSQAIPERITAFLAYFLLKALSKLHSLSLVHRDIKPSSILVSKSGHLKLVDFGLTSPRQAISRDEFNFGTSSYLSPEQVSDQNPDVGMESDIWSCGVTVLEWLLGDNPIHRRNFSSPKKSKKPTSLSSSMNSVSATPHDDDDCSSPALIDQYLAPRKLAREGINQILSNELSNLSSSCKDWIKKCVTERIQDRFSADQLLQHQWVVDHINGKTEDELRKEISVHFTQKQS